MEINWEGITSSAFDRALQNIKWPKHVEAMMTKAEAAQLGQKFKTRIAKVSSTPIITFAGKKLRIPDKLNLQEGQIFFKFMKGCQKDYEARNVIKTSFTLNKDDLQKAFDNLPKVNLMRYFW